MREVPTHWPDGAQDATRLGDDWRLHALPQWGTRDLRGVAFGFREAAEAVYDSLPTRSPDPLFLPLAFLWRHHLELMLKANIKIWCQLTSTPVPKFGGGGLGHDLRQLWDEFERVSSAEVGDQDRSDTRKAREALETFLRLEPQVDASRYPISSKGERYERPERVDLSQLHETALAVSSLLAGAFDQADNWIQLSHEADW